MNEHSFVSNVLWKGQVERVIYNTPGSQESPIVISYFLICGQGYFEHQTFSHLQLGYFVLTF